MDKAEMLGIGHIIQSLICHVKDSGLSYVQGESIKGLEQEDENI